MVSRPTLGTNFRLMACSAISRTVHLARPSGASLHAIAIMRCRSVALNIGLAPGRARSYNARFIPLSR